MARLHDRRVHPPEARIRLAGHAADAGAWSGADPLAEGPPHVSDPILTAIVSTYNAESFMRGCLEDLEAQTIADRIEIVVIDSNSPQREVDIVREFQQRHSNIRYLRTEERETLYKAWNRGVEMARGKYLTNANTDDRHRRDAFEVMV